MLAGLLLFPITGPLYGLRFIVEQIQAELDAELLGEGHLEGELMALSVRHDFGEISDVEYATQEAAILQELNAIRAYKEAKMLELEELHAAEYGDGENKGAAYESEFDGYDYEYEDLGDDTRPVEAEEAIIGDTW